MGALHDFVRGDFGNLWSQTVTVTITNTADSIGRIARSCEVQVEARK